MATGVDQQGRSVGDDGAGDIIAVYEFCAAEYHWGPEYIEACVTDSQLVAYLDRAIDRRDKENQATVDRLTVGVNAGTLITYDREALRRWQSRHPRQQSPTDFRATADRLARMFPQKVTTH